MDCEDVLQQLSDYLDPEARADLCREINAHLKRCRGCKVEVDTIKKTIVLFQAGSGKKIEVPIRVSLELDRALALEYERSRAAKSD